MSAIYNPSLSEKAKAYNLYMLGKNENLIPNPDADETTLIDEFKKIFPNLDMINNDQIDLIIGMESFVGLDYQISETIKHIMDKYQIHGIIWKLMKNDLVISKHAIGEILRDVPIMSDMYFRIGSCTKSFTTTMILILADQGKISITDTIDKWYPEVKYGDKITLEMLANMTSGIRSYSADEEFQNTMKNNIYKFWTEDELIKIGLKNGPECEPGTCWRYCNTNTVMLGVIISKVTNKSYEENLKELILDPLKMSHTSYPLTAELPIPFVHGYSDFRNKFYDQSTFWDPSWARGAGAIISNIDDLLTWGEEIGKGSLFSEKIKKLHILNKVSHLEPFTKTNYYGMGVGVKENGWITHAGNIPGYNSCFAYYPGAASWKQNKDLSSMSDPMWNNGLSFAVMVNKSSEEISNYADIILDEIDKIIKSRSI